MGGFLDDCLKGSCDFDGGKRTQRDDYLYNLRLCM